MKKIILISCSSKKTNGKSKVKNLYTSPLFKKSLEYAYNQKPDKIFILSAKHGLLNLDEEIEPYEKSLNDMNSKEKKEWGKSVLKQLKENTNLEKDLFIFLAGNNYRKFLLTGIKNYRIPMEGLGIGKQLQWLSKKNKYV